MNSYQVTQFRIWATKILREFIVKGFVMDAERLKQGKRGFGQRLLRRTAGANPGNPGQEHKEE